METGYKLIVFDWDGTLANSLGQIVTVMQQAIDALDLEQRTPREIQDVIGLGLNEALGTLYPELSAAGLQELVDRYRAFYTGMPAQSAPLYPDAEETLKRLYDAGYLLAVATGKSRRGLHRALTETGTEKLFHASCCADETFSKPHPRMLENIMDILGVLPSETLMIGDTEFDLQMARNAGTAAVAVAYGAHHPERLLEFEPLACIDCLKALPDWLATCQKNEKHGLEYKSFDKTTG